MINAALKFLETDTVWYNTNYYSLQPFIKVISFFTGIIVAMNTNNNLFSVLYIHIQPELTSNNTPLIGFKGQYNHCLHINAFNGSRRQRSTQLQLCLEMLMVFVFCVVTEQMSPMIWLSFKSMSGTQFFTGLKTGNSSISFCHSQGTLAEIEVPPNDDTALVNEATVLISFFLSHNSIADIMSLLAPLQVFWVLRSQRQPKTRSGNT